MNIILSVNQQYCEEKSDAIIAYKINNNWISMSL